MGGLVCGVPAQDPPAVGSRRWGRLCTQCTCSATFWYCRQYQDLGSRLTLL